MTDKNLQAFELVQLHGTLQAASDASGIPVSTLHYRVSKVNGTPDNSSRVDDTVLKKRVKELESLVETQQSIISKARKTRPVLTAAKAKQKRATKDDYVRVIIPDSHGCKIDPDAAAAFLRDLERLQPREIVMIGDHLDCGGFLAEKQVLGYVAETAYSFADDVAAANEFLDAVQSAAPEAEIHMLEGNHERRIERFCVTQALKNGNPKDAEYLASLFSSEVVLHIKERGINYYKQGVCYHDLRIPATIKLGHCYFTHGSRHGVQAAKKTLEDFGGNVVMGHTHRIASCHKWDVKHGDIGCWNIGFLAKLQPYWRHDSPTGWSHGYGVQFVKNDGDFIHVTVPIINGVSYFLPLLDKIK